MKISAELLQ